LKTIEVLTKLVNVIRPTLRLNAEATGLKDDLISLAPLFPRCVSDYKCFDQNGFPANPFSGGYRSSLKANAEEFCWK
jgi:hypothetical protein